MVAPVLPALTMAEALPSRTSSAARTSDESFLRRTPWAGSSSMAMTSVQATSSRPGGVAHQVGRARPARRRCPRRRPPGAPRPRSRPGPGRRPWRRPPPAGRPARCAAGRRPAGVKSVDLDGLATLVPPAVGADHVGHLGLRGSGGTRCGPAGSAASWRPGGCGPWPWRSSSWGRPSSVLQLSADRAGGVRLPWPGRVPGRRRSGLPGGCAPPAAAGTRGTGYWADRSTSRLAHRGSLGATHPHDSVVAVGPALGAQPPAGLAAERGQGQLEDHGVVDHGPQVELVVDDAGRPPRRRGRRGGRRARRSARAPRSTSSPPTGSGAAPARPRSTGPATVPVTMTPPSKDCEDHVAGRPRPPRARRCRPASGPRSARSGSSRPRRTSCQRVPGDPAEPGHVDDERVVGHVRLLRAERALGSGPGRRTRPRRPRGSPAPGGRRARRPAGRSPGASRGPAWTVRMIRSRTISMPASFWSQ